MTEAIPNKNEPAPGIRWVCPLPPSEVVYRLRHAGTEPPDAGGKAILVPPVSVRWLVRRKAVLRFPRQKSLFSRSYAELSIQGNGTTDADGSGHSSTLVSGTIQTDISPLGMVAIIGSFILFMSFLIFSADAHRLHEAFGGWQDRHPLASPALQVTAILFPLYLWPLRTRLLPFLPDRLKERLGIGNEDLHQALVCGFLERALGGSPVLPKASAS